MQASSRLRIARQLRVRAARVRVGSILLIVTMLAGAFVTQRIFAAPQTSVDLSTYVRVGRFDLPEPTRTTPPANSLLAQEASAVTYNWHIGRSGDQDRLAHRLDDAGSRQQSSGH